MVRYNKLVFVSISDTCRSVWAAAISRQLCSETRLVIYSRGTVVLFPEPPNPKGVAIARSKGLFIDDHMSSQICSSDFGEKTLVLVMSELIKKQIYEEYKEALHVHTLKEYVDEIGDIEVAYGGDLVQYGENFEEIERLVQKIIDKIRENLEANLEG